MDTSSHSPTGQNNRANAGQYTGQRQLRRFVTVLASLLVLPLAQSATNWNWVQTGGGCYTPTVVFSEVQPGLAYARTDVGGAYRWDNATSQWVSLLDSTSWTESHLNGVLSVAASPRNADKVALACGLYTNAWDGLNGVILTSDNQGVTWTKTVMPFKIGGNMPGRGMGERLAYDPNNDSIMFYAASDGNGLWKSSDGGINWAKVTAFPNPGNWSPQATDPIDIYNRTPGVVWVTFDKRTGTSGNATQTIYVGVADKNNGIYVSTNGGTSWSRLAGQPTGFLCHRGIVEPSLGYLYTTWNDSGGPFDGGKGDVWKYAIATATWTRISPVPSSDPGMGWGYNGIAIDRSNPSTLMVGTQSSYYPDGAVWRSIDGGATWSKSWEYTNNGASRSFRTVLDVSAAPWMANPGTYTAPQYNINLGPAVAGISIDPFDSNNVFVCSGWAGLWRSTNLTNWVPGGSGTCTFTIGSRGIQGNGESDMISPPSGAPLLTAMLDLGGFRHTDLTAVPSTRYTLLWYNNSSIDFAENDPNQIVRVGRGQPDNGDPGRSIAISGDNGITWTEPNQPANAVGGTVASSCSGTANLVWAPQEDVSVPVSYSTNGGNSWSSSTGIPKGAQVRADRVTPGKFYGFFHQNFYVSTNQGVDFTSTASGLPYNGQMRPVFGRAGDIWLAGETGGLWHSTNSGSSWTKLSNVTDAWTVGFGKAAPRQSYPAVYIGGRIGSVYGIYRSDDGGSNWTLMTDSGHQYGALTVALTADRNIYGRCYSTTGFGGVIYSTPDSGGTSGTAHLVNVSIRATAGTGANTLIAGFVLSGAGSKLMLLRGIGPTLSDYKVSDPLVDPSIVLYNSGGTSLGKNDDWGGASTLSSTFASLGAFSLAASSKDAALLTPLTAGAHTMHVTTSNSTSGAALAEVYDADTSSPDLHLVNIAGRGAVDASSNLIAGFVVNGTGSMNVLVRAVGPTLTDYGVTGVLSNPKVTIYNSSGVAIASNDDWGGSSALSSTFTQVGAFPLPSSSKDAAILLTLNPGAYSAVVSGVNGATGVALVEVYATPSSDGLSSSAPLATPLAWTTTAPLVSATADASHSIVSVKDPSVVFHDGRWHIFATIASSNGWRIGYLNFTNWDQAAQAKLARLEDNPFFSGAYNCAPQVFYFRPQNKWYLIFQSQQPRFSTTDNITDVMSWSKPQDFFVGTPKSVVEGWIDYWIICDDTHAYLFFSDDHGRYYRSRTRIEDFPRGFDEPVIVMQEANPADLFEGSCVYRIKGTNQFLCLIECADKNWSRYYRAFTTDRLDGEWKPLSGADSAASPFAGNPNVSAEPGAIPWANGISHGELLREGNDETMTVDPKNLQLLYQGIPPGTSAPDYLLLPYRLALLRSAALPSSSAP